jgi:hypothetical protein
MSSPFGLRFSPCRCIWICAFRWLRVPYAFGHSSPAVILLLSHTNTELLAEKGHTGQHVATLVETLDLIMPSTGSLLDGVPRQGHERVSPRRFGCTLVGG